MLLWRGRWIPCSYILSGLSRPPSNHPEGSSLSATQKVSNPFLKPFFTSCLHSIMVLIHRQQEQQHWRNHPNTENKIVSIIKEFIERSRSTHNIFQSVHCVSFCACCKSNSLWNRKLLTSLQRILYCFSLIQSIHYITFLIVDNVA